MRCTCAVPALHCRYQVAECQAGKDTACAPVTLCKSGQFLDTPTTPTTDNVCKPVTECTADKQYVACEPIHHRNS